MPTPNDAALIRELAQRALDLKRITDIRNATAASAQVIEAAYTAELAAQAELATTAARLGVPLAEATTSYGSTTAAGAGAAAFGWPAILAGLAIFGAIGGSIYMAKNWGKPSVEPVRAGPAMLTPRPASTPPTSTRVPERKGDAYYLYVVNTSGWSYYIGRPEDVEGKASKSFQDGGTGDQPIQFRRLVETKFNSSNEAREYLKSHVSPGKQSVWTGKWLKFNGGEEFRTVHVGI